MSLTNFPGSANSSPLDPSITKVTIPALAEMKRQGKPISALTAYDYATARLVDEAGIDLVLVGDSLAMVVMGQDNTLAVTVDEMLHHTRACGARFGVRWWSLICRLAAITAQWRRAWRMPCGSSKRPAPRR